MKATVLGAARFLASRPLTPLGTLQSKSDYDDQIGYVVRLQSCCH